MGVLPAQKVALLYERFKNVDVTFTKDMLQVTGLLTEQVHLKCGSDFWPCVLFATSFQGAKVVANIKSGLLNKLRLANNLVSLRLCFKNADKANPVTFFVSGRVAKTAPFKNSEDVSLLTIQFTNRPSDDLVEIVGRVLDANLNSSKGSEERILLTEETQRKIKLFTKETVAVIQNVPRRCILRELSFLHARVIMLGVAKFLIDKEAVLRVDFDDPRENFMIKGRFAASEAVEGKKEMVVLELEYDKPYIPMGYKVRINEFLNTLRADSRTSSEPASPARTA